MGIEFSSPVGFLNWLSGEECLPWLIIQARLLRRKAAELRLPAELWPYPGPGEMAANDWQDSVDAVAHEFWLFLRENFCREKISLPAELAFATEQSAHLVAAYLRSAFLNHLRSLARRKDVDLYRYLYRRLREDMPHCPEFHFSSIDGWKFYSLQSRGKCLRRIATRIPAPYRSWPSPKNIISEKQFLNFRKADLCVLARFFWEEATKRLLQPHFLPLNELTAFLAEHYDCLQTGDDQAGFQEVFIEGQTSLIPQTQTHGLMMLAQQLVSSWSTSRRMVFSLSLDPGDLTLKEIARRAGISGPSHAKYHLDAACQDLARFCEAWPGVAPPPSDRNFWIEFLLCAAAVCKKSIDGRKDGYEQSSNPLPESEP